MEILPSDCVPNASPSQYNTAAYRSELTRQVFVSRHLHHSCYVSEPDKFRESIALTTPRSFYTTLLSGGFESVSCQQRWNGQA